MAEPHPPTDEESAPLLRNSDIPNDAQDDAPGKQTFWTRLADITQHPITFATWILLGLCLFLLLLASIFIGLFAGARHELGKHKNEPPQTSTATVSVTESYTQTATQTEISVSTQTETETQTRVTTTTEVPTIPSPDPKTLPCGSRDCILLSASILSSLDLSVDPCENFYQYTAGGWLKDHPIPSDKGSFGNFENVQLQNERILKDILENDTPDSLDTFDLKSIAKLKDLYQSCINEDQLDEIGMKPLLDVVKTVTQLYNGSTSIEPELMRFSNSDGYQWTQTKGDKNGLTAALAYLHSRDIGALFSFEIEGDVGNDPNLMSLWFYQPDLGLPSKEYYEEEDITALYSATIERLLLAIYEEQTAALPPRVKWPPLPWPPWGDDGDSDGSKPENNTVKAKRLAKEVVKFETKIARASQDLDELFDPIGSYNPTAISDFTSTLPEISFPEYLATFAPRSFPTQVIVSYPPYVSSLSTLLSSTDTETIEAYLVARAALSLSSWLGTGTEAWKAVRALQETLAGLKKGTPQDRPEYCAKQVSNALGYAAGRFFVGKAFGGDGKKKAFEVITNVVQAFEASLPHLDWMDKNSSKAAAEKAAVIDVKVGYPMYPNTESSYSIWAYYSIADVDKKDYFGSLLSLSVAEERRKWLKFGKQRNKLAWEMYAHTVNAYFNPPSNEIVFPAGILRPPWFDKDWPGYLKYGAMGAVAAHELTHAFDSAGRLYNQQGKLEEWWTNTTSENFNGIQKCISDQYSGYTIDDGKGHKVHVNGNLTSGENIADAGLINSYRAWKAQYDDAFDNGEEYALPGLNYTKEQLFFISFGRSWARNMRPASALQRIRTDPHSPTQFRVDGTLSNIPEFAKAFGCSVGTKLNPPKEKQCRLWS